MNNEVQAHNRERLQQRLRAFMMAETGVGFRALVYFGEPIFQLYEVDVERFLKDAPAVTDPDLLARSIAALENARLFWAYFSSNERRRGRLSALVERMLGENSTEEERQQFLILLETMQDRWLSMDVSVRERGESESSFRTLTFSEVLDHFRNDGHYAATEEIAGSERFGPDRLNLPDAIALFARPMLERQEVLQDADAFEHAMNRAGEYWELAKMPLPEYRNRLEMLKNAFASSAEEARQIEKEAEQMTARFFELFPEQRPPAAN